MHHYFFIQVFVKILYTLVNLLILYFLSIHIINNLLHDVLVVVFYYYYLQHMKDKFWNFLFYKFIFIFGVMNVQYMEEVLLWCGWFSFVGAFHLLSQLCKDRFEYVSKPLFIFNLFDTWYMIIYFKESLSLIIYFHHFLQVDTVT